MADYIDHVFLHFVADVAEVDGLQMKKILHFPNENDLNWKRLREQLNVHSGTRIYIKKKGEEWNEITRSTPDLNSNRK